jgi:hypothetical protein
VLVPGSRPHIGVMDLDLTDEETAALTQELHDNVENDVTRSRLASAR